ncbi:MAG: tetratricopeptide repeat protein [Candidatus Omnitrophica bacterium]|nr:tetratricopeptide repeat protein [Candidatus Omnitrophota bacterium]
MGNLCKTRKNEYQKILSEYPDHLLAQSALKEIAICYQKQGKFEEAVGQYEKSLELKSFSSDGYEHYQMALCYSELKQTEKAKEMLQKVISNEEAKLKLKELGG